MSKKHSPSSEKKSYASLKQIASLLKVSEHEIKKFVKVGMPRVSENEFNLVESVQWYIDYLQYWRDRRTVKEMAEMFGISNRWLQRLVVEKGIPKEKFGVYMISSTVLAYISYLKEQVKSASEGSTTLNEEKKRLIAMQASLREIELLEKQRMLVPKQLVEHVALNLTVTFGKKLDSIPGTILNKLFVTKTKEEMLIILNDTIHKIKLELSNGIK